MLYGIEFVPNVETLSSELMKKDFGCSDRVIIFGNAPYTELCIKLNVFPCNLKEGSMTKLVCGDYRCGWHGTSDEVLKADNPFEPEYEVWGCPRCKAVDNMYNACDEPDCWDIVQCGTPTLTGYRSTCAKHRPSP
jgi:hypothetical protein